MTAILLDIEPIEAVRFAAVMILTIAFAHLIICGTDRRGR